MAIALPVGIGDRGLADRVRPADGARAGRRVDDRDARRDAPSVVLALFGTPDLRGARARASSARPRERRRARALVLRRGGDALAGRAAAGRREPCARASRRSRRHVREASYAVGKTKIATTRRVLLPAARPSVITGAMLGLGRVIGDTAIILVLLGATLNLQGRRVDPAASTLRGTGSTLTSYIYANAPTGEGNQPDKAYAAAFVLLMIVLALNVGVDVYSAAGRRRLRWS